MAGGGYLRYVALGDSQTEGLGDGDEVRGLRGWADRLAELIARDNPDLRYANLAVRGLLAGQVRARQLAPALALRPDLATVVAGVNDVLRRRFDADEVAGHLEAMFAALTAQGARVATLTFPDIGRIAPLARPLAPRGHALIAAAVAHALELPGSDDSWTHPLPPDPMARTGLRAVGAELRWAGTFLGPWLVRRVRGRSSGDGRQAKRPELLPISDPISHPID
ncbi:SGNH/GDSL hydrolase family protein [Streptomyces sp. NPDC050788]|uniref:SGNH/GDSL hydrolase family protein n=1 Tax=Streptomyces sp. NPDC050788 TaxID=3155041 RepID=UPI00344A943E